jgi:S1-C subfamily serine protease
MISRTKISFLIISWLMLSAISGCRILPYDRYLDINAVDEDFVKLKLCLRAIKYNSPTWEDNISHADDVKKAKSLGFTEQYCARMTGRVFPGQNASFKSTPTEEVEKLKPPQVTKVTPRSKRPQPIAKVTPQPRKQRRPTKRSEPSRKSGSTGSGFFVSKLGHVVTNAHVVKDCRSIAVGDNAKKQVATILLETDIRNDLALLKISNTQMASVETKSLISKLGLKLVPTASEGLLRSDDVELGEDVLVSGYPYGEIYSDTIKVTKGIVSANKGIGDDTGQFQMDAAVQPGNSGGPIYDTYGNIIGVVVAQLNKLKFAKAIGSLPENVNFGIKASTVRQFLNASGLPTKWSKRSKAMSTRDLAMIAKKQTVMVVCRR